MATLSEYLVSIAQGVKAIQNAEHFSKWNRKACSDLIEGIREVDSHLWAIVDGVITGEYTIEGDFKIEQIEEGGHDGNTQDT